MLIHLEHLSHSDAISHGKHSGRRVVHHLDWPPRPWWPSPCIAGSCGRRWKWWGWPGPPEPPSQTPPPWSPRASRCLTRVNFFLSTVHCSARAILSQHLLHRRKNSAQIFFGENFTTSSCDGGRSSTEARRALLRPPLLPPHHCKHTLGYYYRAARAFNSHLPDRRLFAQKYDILKSKHEIECFILSTRSSYLGI